MPIYRICLLCNSSHQCPIVECLALILHVIICKLQAIKEVNLRYNNNSIEKSMAVT